MALGSLIIPSPKEAPEWQKCLTWSSVCRREKGNIRPCVQRLCHQELIVSKGPVYNCQRLPETDCLWPLFPLSKICECFSGFWHDWNDVNTDRFDSLHFVAVDSLIPVVPGQAGGGSFQKEKNYIAQKEFAYRMCAWWPTSAMPKSFLCCERAFCPSMVVMFCALKWSVLMSWCLFRGQVMWWSRHLMRCDGLCCVMSRDAMRCHGD